LFSNACANPKKNIKSLYLLIISQPHSGQGTLTSNHKTHIGAGCICLAPNWILENGRGMRAPIAAEQAKKGALCRAPQLPSEKGLDQRL